MRNGVRPEPADLVDITCEGTREIAQFRLSMEISRAKDFNEVLHEIARLPDVARIETSEPFRAT